MEIGIFRRREKGEKAMKTTERTYLKGSVWLYRDENGSFAEEYRIRSVIGEGGSSVCYEAAPQAV